MTPCAIVLNDASRLSAADRPSTAATPSWHARSAVMSRRRGDAPEVPESHGGRRHTEPSPRGHSKECTELRTPRWTKTALDSPA